MLDRVGLTGVLSFIGQPTMVRYLKDSPEAIKAHPARAGAAKPTEVERISEFGLRIAEFSEDNG